MPQALIAPILGAVLPTVIGGIMGNSAAKGSQQNYQNNAQQALGITGNNTNNALQQFLSLASNIKNPASAQQINPAQAKGYGLGMTTTQGTQPQSGVDYSSVLAALPKAS